MNGACTQTTSAFRDREAMRVRVNPRPLFALAERTFSAAALCGLLALAPAPSAAQSSHGATHLLIISGAGGEPAYKEQFFTLGARLAEAATKKYGLSAANVIFLA